MINYTEPKLKDFKCFKLPIDELPKCKELLILGNTYNFFGTYKDGDLSDFTQTPWSGEGATSNFMSFGQFVMNGGHATIIASKETCNYYRTLYKEFYKAGFGTTHPKVVLFEIDDTKFLKGNFKIKDGKEEKLVKGEYFWAQDKDGKWEFNYPDFLKSFFENGEKRMFDLIIANPPYGKSSSLSKKIVNFLLGKKIAKEMAVVSPKNTCKNENISKVIDSATLIKKNPFEGAVFAENTLCVFHTGKEKGNVDWVSFYLTPKSVELYKAVQVYNRTHSPCFTVVDGNQFKKKFQCKIPELSKNVWTKYKDHLEVLFKDRLNEVFSPKSEGIFVKTIWTAENGVHFGDAHDTLYNYGKKEWDTNWEKDRRVDLFVFPNEQYKNNFRDWWYSITKTSKTKIRKGLTNAFLDLNRDYVGAGAECYLETFPNLDWSHSWTDEEILKEIGLPENFLEEKE